MISNELESFINKETIPQIKENPLTFQEITQQPHYENVMSNIYAFFFDSKGEHGFEKLFIHSLFELLKEKKVTTEFVATYWNIEREVVTENKKRIDLKLTSTDQAIIIENKVYHCLNNNLKEYWDSISDYKTKIGIVLSLYSIKKTGHKNFINITHIELMGKIKQNLGSFLTYSKDKYLVFLNDFIQNIYNLSTNTMEASDINFIIKNNNKIAQIIELNEKYNEHVNDAIDIVCSNIGDNVVKQYDGFWYIRSKENKDLVFTIEPPKEKLSMAIIVELQGKAINDCSSISEEIFTKEELKTIDRGYFGKQKIAEDYFHFAGEWDYEIDNPQKVTYLSNTIIELIEKDHLLSIFNKLDKQLSNVRKGK